MPPLQSSKSQSITAAPIPPIPPGPGPIECQLQWQLRLERRTQDGHPDARELLTSPANRCTRMQLARTAA